MQRVSATATSNWQSLTACKKLPQEWNAFECKPRYKPEQNLAPLDGASQVFDYIWFTVGLLGMLITGRSLWLAIEDLTFLKAMKVNGLRTVVAVMNIRTQAVRLAIVTMVTLGAVLTILHNIHPNLYVSLWSYLNHASVLVIVGTAAFASICDTFDREKIVRMEREGDE